MLDLVPLHLKGARRKLFERVLKDGPHEIHIAKLGEPLRQGLRWISSGRAPARQSGRSYGSQHRARTGSLRLGVPDIATRRTRGLHVLFSPHRRSFATATERLSIPP